MPDVELILCLDAETAAIVCLAVRHPMSSAMVYLAIEAQATPESEAFALAPLRDEGRTVMVDKIPLPKPPDAVKFFHLVAAVLMGVPPRAEFVIRHAPLVDPAQRRRAADWSMLAVLEAFGIVHVPTRSARVDLLRLVASGDNWSATLGRQPFDLAEAPHSPDDFDTSGEITSMSRLAVRPFRHADAAALVARMRADASGAFDADDVAALSDELTLAVRSDRLAEPLRAGSHAYASAEYVELVVRPRDGSTLGGFVGLLTFYGAVDECWVAFLLAEARGGGTILMECAARRARERGFGRLCVWTTADNHDAIQFYDRLGFARSPLIPRDLHGVDAHVAFDYTL